MEYMPEFSVKRPATLSDAVQAHNDNPNARYLAGGTDILVNVRRGIVTPETLIDLSAISELQGISESADGGLRIGAAVTLSELGSDPRVMGNYPAISEAAREVAATSHREVATLGGNLCLDTRCVFYNQSEWWRNANDYCLKYNGDTCHVAPSGDTCFAAFSGDVAPAVLVHDGLVEIIGPDGQRMVPLGDIYEDDGMAHLKLAKGEILSAVILPKPESGTSAYAKVRVRDAIDFPLVGVAIRLARSGETLSAISVALTGTNARPFVLEGTEDLVGKPLDDAALETLVELIPKQIQPMTSTFTPPGYRRKVVTNLTRATAKKLFEQA
jgi:4-hydroxybenzoyl-CoA reductase subunit beta